MAIKKLRAALTVILMLIGYAVVAQSYAESALLFSQSQPGGSARIQGVGGAQIALGGDYSSALSNPAGLGMYNRSEFTFTPALSFYSAETQYLGNSEKENSTLFNIPGISFVLHLPKESNGFLGGAFGASMTRINDFNRTFSYSGRNDGQNANSIVDYFLEQADGKNVDQFEPGGFNHNTITELAYRTYLIDPVSEWDPDEPDDIYYTFVPLESNQSEDITTKKAGYQWSFSYGANYKDIFFFGGGIGLTTLRYESKKVYREDYLDTENIFSMDMTENLDIRGSGINGTLGVIARPVNFLQLGISFVTPTFYQITETYDARLNAHWNDFDYYEDGVTILGDETWETDIIKSEYTLTTPLKVSGGIAFISKHGFISADIEMMNPAKAKYSSDIGIPDNPENEDIRGSFKKVYNYRIGGEFRHEIFRVRAGYSVMGNPYSNNDYNYKNVSISGGAGLRFEKFYIDLAVISKKVDSNYSPYVLSDNSQPVARLKNKTLTSMITFGFTF